MPCASCLDDAAIDECYRSEPRSDDLWAFVSRYRTGVPIACEKYLSFQLLWLDILNIVVVYG
jgi:hypothetical protein